MEDYKKKYEQALERARTIVENQNASSVWKDWLCNTFPELKSEDDRIRKMLIEFFGKGAENNSTTNGISDKDIISWLEKQGKEDMIPLDKVIKFLDDQLVNDKDEVTGEHFINFQNYGAFKESFISYFKRKMLEKQGEPTEISPSEFDSRLNKLLKQFESLPKEELITNLSYYLNIIQNDGTYKIEKQGEKSQRMISAEAKEALYNKPALSEEDEVKINRIVACLENLNVADNDILLKDVDWLKSFKERIGG